MTAAAATIWRIAVRGLVKRKLSDDDARVVARSLRWLPQTVADIVPERASLYGGNVAMAAADALDAWWAECGMAWTVEDYARVMREVAGCDGRKLEYADL